MLTEYRFHSVPWVYIFLTVSLLLPRIPVLGKFFNVINTALHEFGHAIVAILAGGDVNRISLNNDASGITATAGLNSKTATFFVALAGYPFAASTAWLAFYLIDIQAYTALLLGLSVFFVVMLLFWIRNAYGILWVMLFCGINIYFISVDNEYVITLLSIFYAVMILTESIVSTIVQLKICLFDRKTTCDAVVLSGITHVPAVVWALLFLLYSGWVAYFVAINFIVAFPS